MISAYFLNDIIEYKMKKVLLIQPDNMAKIYFPERPVMGLGYLGAVLENAGHQVEIVDMRFSKYNNKYLISTIKRFSPDFIGFSISSLTMNIAYGIIKIIKKHTKAKIICGGPQVSLVPEMIMKNKDIDFCITHEGDISFVDFVTMYPNNISWKDIPGLVVRKPNGKLKINNNDVITELNNIPFPAWHLFPLDEYRGGVSKIEFPILSSRGCPYQCIYCESTLINGKYRARSAKNVVDEIEWCVKEFNAKKFQFIDDNFALIQDRVYDICNEIINRKLEISWIVGQGFTANRANYKMFKLMKKSGCHTIYFGVESADDEVLKFIKKPANLKQIKKAIIEAHKAGLTVKAPFISGLPKSTFKKELGYIKFFKEMKIDMPRMATIIPYPKTEIYEWVKKNATPIGPLETAHLRLSQTRGALDSDLVYPSYETDDFPLHERIKILKIFQKESEKWILQRRFGKIFGYMAFIVSRNSKLRAWGYKMFKKLGKGEF